MRRLAIIVWFAVGLASCGRPLLIPFSDRHIGIYPVYAQAGTNWLEGNDLYASTDAIFIFRYSPLAAALFTVFGLQSLLLGSFTCALINVVVFLFGLRSWGRMLFPGEQGSGRRALFYLLAAPLSASGLVDGQANALVIGLLMAASAQGLRGQWTRAALGSALACALKLYPIAFALVLSALCPRRFGLRYLAGVFLVLALPFVLQDVEYVTRQYEGWARLLSLDQGRQNWPLEISYRDLRLLFRVWITPLPEWLYTLIQVGSGAGIALLCLAAKAAGWSSLRLASLVLNSTCVWMLLMGPCTEGTTYILLAPTLACLVIEARARRLGPARQGILWAAYMLLTVASAAVWFPDGKMIHNWGPHALAALLVGAYILLDTLPELLRLLVRRALPSLPREQGRDAELIRASQYAQAGH